MNTLTDVEEMTKRNHDQAVSQDKGGHNWRRAHRFMLLKWALILTAACGLALLLQAIGQMGELLTTTVFILCLCGAMFFLGRYVEFHSREK